MYKCDEIWEKSPYVAQGNFAENNNNNNNNLKIAMFFFTFY